MCVNLHIRGENLWIEQARELADLVGRENILWWDEDDAVAPEPEWHTHSDLAFCLCPVAVEATLTRAGYNVARGWSEPERCDYVAWKEPRP